MQETANILYFASFIDNLYDYSLNNEAFTKLASIYLTSNIKL